MDFNAVIDKIMTDVNGGSAEPFIIYRDQSGDWHCDHTQNQYGEQFGWVEDIKEKDYLAVTFTGKDFAKGSFPYVYDAVLCQRFREEYYVARSSGKDTDQLHAMTCFMNDNIGEFSHEATDYLTTLDRPLAALTQMCPFSLTTDNDDWSYSEDLAQDAIDHIENAVNDRLRSRGSKNLPEKRYIDGYEEKHAIQLAGRLVIFAENPKAEESYLVCFAKWDNPLNMTECYDIQRFTDFVDAMSVFNDYHATLLNEIKKERAELGRPTQILTAANCVPNGLDEDLTGKVIIIKPEVLSPEYRADTRQLKICTGGFGARPHARGSAVFCTDLFSGKQSRFERYDVLGTADLERLPGWALKKLKLMEALKEPGVFEYGGYHFKPVRQFRKGEVERRLEVDSRPWKMDAQYAMRNMRSDHELGLSAYDWKKTGTDYSHKGFFAASGDSTADIFMCIENGNLYTPGENELYRYKEPTQKQKAPDKKPSLMDRLDDAKAEAAARNAERKDAPNIKKRGNLEVD